MARFNPHNVTHPNQIQNLCETLSHADLADLAEHLLTPKWQSQWGVHELEKLVVPEMAQRLRHISAVVGV